MVTSHQLAALYLLWRRRRNRFRKRGRRYYVRPSHLNQIHASFEMFNRYYASQDPNDLQQFCRFTPAEFDELYSYVENQLSTHPRTHLRPISGRQRLVIFLR